MLSIHISNLYLSAHLILTSLELTQRCVFQSISYSLPVETSSNRSSAGIDGNCLRRKIFSGTRESRRSGSTSMMTGVRKLVVSLRSIHRRLWLLCCGINTIAVEVGAITNLPLVWGSHDDVTVRGAKCPPCFVALSSRCAVAAELKVAYALSRNVDGAGHYESERSACGGEALELHVCSSVK
jgi:hypothetical protein